jgi:hypothetical protein
MDNRFQLGNYTYQITAHPVDLADTEELFSEALTAVARAATSSYSADWEIVSHSLTTVEGRLVISFLLRCSTSSRPPPRGS